MRGIQLDINDSTEVLSPLSIVDIEKYNWHVADELWFNYEEGQVDPIVQDNIISCQELRRIIDEKSLQFASVNLRAFPSGVTITEPKDYVEYINSDCMLVFLCHDYGDVEVYCKDASVLNRIYEAYHNSPIVDSIDWITDENDGRTRFYV